MAEIGWTARIQSYKRASLRCSIHADFEAPSQPDVLDLKIEPARGFSRLCGGLAKFNATWSGRSVSLAVDLFE